MADRPDHWVRASTAGPDEPDPYKSDGQAPDSMDETASLVGVEAELPAPAVFVNALPYRGAAEQSDEPGAVLLNSAWQAAAKDCLRPSAPKADSDAPLDASGEAELPESADEECCAESGCLEPDSMEMRQPASLVKLVGVPRESSSREELSEDRSHPTAKAVLDP
jgi:hypothetical protein